MAYQKMVPFLGATLWVYNCRLGIGLVQLLQSSFVDWLEFGTLVYTFTKNAANAYLESFHLHDERILLSAQ